MQKIFTIEPIDALKIAIQSEQEMQNYYNQAAELVKDGDAKSILQGLAARAAEHRKNSIEQYSRFSGKKILFLNLDKRHKLNSLQRCPDSPNEAVRVAKRNEKEMYEFYATVSRRFIDAELRAFFRKLAGEHLQHHTLLEASFVEPLALDQEIDQNQDQESGFSDIPEEHHENR